MAVKEFALPDLGEGLTESEIVEWHVAVGDLVTLNQPIAEVETAKAIVSLPSPVAGKISALHAEPGSTVQVGTRIVTFELDGGPDAASDAAGTPAGGGASAGAGAGAGAGTGAGTESAKADSAGQAPAAEVAPERNAVLVGYGPAVESGKRPTRKPRAVRAASAAAAEAPSAATVAEPAPVAAPVPAPETAPQTAPEPAVTPADARTKTTPPVRKLAADRGVDLTQLTGTGPEGIITRDDVLSAAEQSSAPAATSEESAAGSPAPQAARAFAGTRPRETRTPIKSVRKATAAAMVASAFTAPHVTEFLTIDVTRTVELVAKLKAKGTAASVLSVVAKALCIGVARHPSLNSRWDAEANEIVEFGYINLGIAVATPRGLMVPNLKDADAMSLAELTDAIGDLARNARASKATPASLNGGTISITNVGVFGIDAGTPILNPGEAAILAMGAVRRMPWEHHGDIALRDVMTLSLSFDHRLVDGEQGARFLTDVGSILNDPGTVLTMV
ncbi:dihydrolipoamide acetyltransferase family protein [Salinibacterium sp. SWN248]|uniref:dihydrolipoamide acetyltransferase family protein n=1 Tax=Salinibacterium sp. SWN248 TaxID=2792056 RepID=UPI0018CF87C3|nr:dihydrolipoamide acetyltransferase family protein [Salinibacterium sp. SWN248]MBH0023795.1 2-oxo acid dehydrogenase subunit E2 [Salinibacterium sp. SWN248]